MKNTKIMISGDRTTAYQYSRPPTGVRLQRADIEWPTSASPAISDPNTTQNDAEMASSPSRRVITTPPTMITP